MREGKRHSKSKSNGKNEMPGERLTSGTDVTNSKVAELMIEIKIDELKQYWRISRNNIRYTSPVL